MSMERGWKNTSLFDDSKGVDPEDMVEEMKQYAKSFKGSSKQDYFVFAYYLKNEDKFVIMDWECVR